MIKKLSTVGDRLGLIIDAPILERLDIDKDTLLEIETDGGTLIIRPLRRASQAERVMAAAETLMDVHAETFRKLAK
jgi:antitoxin component of MazEF toxin-antitoxin module